MAVLFGKILKVMMGAKVVVRARVRVKTSMLVKKEEKAKAWTPWTSTTISER